MKVTKLEITSSLVRIEVEDGDATVDVHSAIGKTCGRKIAVRDGVIEVYDEPWEKVID